MHKVVLLQIAEVTGSHASKVKAVAYNKYYFNLKNNKLIRQNFFYVLQTKWDQSIAIC